MTAMLISLAFGLCVGIAAHIVAKLKRAEWEEENDKDYEPPK